MGSFYAHPIKEDFLVVTDDIHAIIYSRRRCSMAARISRSLSRCVWGWVGQC